jgi:hypothetical protein
MGKKEVEVEDLAIQNTLVLTAEERLILIANLIVDKIDNDLRNGQPLFAAIAEASNE